MTPQTSTVAAVPTFEPGQRVHLVGYWTDHREGEVLREHCAGIYDVQVPGYNGPHRVAAKYMRPTEERA